MLSGNTAKYIEVFFGYNHFMSKNISHILALILAFALSYISLNSALKNYDIQIIAFVFTIYFFLKKTVMKSNFQLLDGMIATFIITGVVETSGGLSSPFFFLYFFLIFSLSLLLEPVISISTTLTIVFTYILTSPAEYTLKDFVPLLSLPLLTPFALVLGEEYQQILKKNNQLKDSNFFLTLVIKSYIKHIRSLTDNFLGDHELKEIKKTVQKMEKSIDDYEKSA